VIWATNATPMPMFTMIEKPIATNDNHKHNGKPAGQPCEEGDLQCEVCKQMNEMHIVTADELLQGRREMLILHAGQVYRLMRTRNDKLILQK
jgi:hemin uptake protein HemP